MSWEKIQCPLHDHKAFVSRRFLFQVLWNLKQNASATVWMLHYHKGRMALHSFLQKMNVRFNILIIKGDSALWENDTCLPPAWQDVITTALEGDLFWAILEDFCLKEGIWSIYTWKEQFQDIWNCWKVEKAGNRSSTHDVGYCREFVWL